MAHPVYNQNLGLIGILAQNTGTDPLAGTWVLNEAITFSYSLGLPNIVSFNFTSNDTSFYGFYFDVNGDGDNSLGYRTNQEYSFNEIYDSSGNIISGEEAYKTITITSKLSEVTNGDTLLTWLQANATKQGASTPTLISFSIDGTSYQAEEGMTWSEWVESSYNTGGFYIIAVNTRVIFSNGTDYVSSEGFPGDFANNTSQIVANGTYYKFNSGGGN